ncbi:MAG: ABC transporter transmembrane domain-containing protein, partial [Acidimicrobiia bacterium]|nr:ABC transporter transmembrane domain-containing protein [Acidimicrobiia bacterium]
MSMAGWGGQAPLGFSGTPPEVQAKVEAYMAEGPPDVAVDVPAFSQSEYDRRPFTMRRFLRPHRLALFGVFVLLAAEAVMAQAGPVLLQIAIDDGVQAGDRGVVVRMGVIFATLVPLAIGLGVVRTMAAGRVGARIMADLRVKVFSHFQRLSIDFYTNERAGV